jgi:hypothetical protein
VNADRCRIADECTIAGGCSITTAPFLVSLSEVVPKKESAATIAPAPFALGGVVFTIFLFFLFFSLCLQIHKKMFVFAYLSLADTQIYSPKIRWVWDGLREQEGCT